MKSKLKKLIVIALATTMLLGGSLAANAAPRVCTHSPVPFSNTYTSTYNCTSHSNCTITVYNTFKGARCTLCGQTFNYHLADSYSTHSNGR